MNLLLRPILVVGSIVFLVGASMFLAFWYPKRKLSHLMDPNGIPGAFEPHLKRYQELGRLVLTLATASIAFLLNFLIGQPADRQVTLYGVRLSRVAPWSILFLCASVFFIICFMSLSNYFYESYSHFRYVKDDLKRPGEGEYKRWKYSTVLSCGYLGLERFYFKCIHIHRRRRSLCIRLGRRCRATRRFPSIGRRWIVWRLCGAVP